MSVSILAGWRAPSLSYSYSLVCSIQALRYTYLTSKFSSHACQRYFRPVGKESRYTLRNDRSGSGDGTIRYKYKVLDDGGYKMYQWWHRWCKDVSRLWLTRW